MNACRCLIVILVAVAMASAAAAQVPGPPGGGFGGQMPPRPVGGGYGLGGGNNSIGVPKSSVIAINQQFAALVSQKHQLEIAFSTVTQQLEEAKNKAKTGLAVASETASLEARTAQLAGQIDQVDRDIATVGRLKLLASPVDITLKSSPIRQAAEALARASKLSISVDPKVPQDVKVNAEAQNVPLGAVLEVIADAAGLIIAPTDDGGLLLRLPGKLVVGNNTYTTDGDAAPWSDDWGILTSGIEIGRRWLELFNPYSYGRRPMNMPSPYGVTPPPATVKPVPVPPVKPAPKPVKGSGSTGSSKGK